MDDSGGFGAPPPPPPPGAGGGGSIPQRGLGDILSVAFEVYKANAAKLIQIVAIVVIPLTFVMALLTQVAFKQHCDAKTLSDLTSNCVASFGRSLLIGALTYFIAVAIQQLLIGALTRGAAGALIGRDVDVSASYQYAFSRLGPLIGLALLVALVVGVGFILLFIPGIIFLVFLAVSVPAFIIEGLGVTDSMSRSWKLVSGSWWHTLGVIFVAAIIAGVINAILTAIGGHTFFGVWILSAIAQIITAPFVALVSVVLYVDLRARHESLNASTLAMDLDRT
jgi:heme exporter protein D